MHNQSCTCTQKAPNQNKNHNKTTNSDNTQTQSMQTAIPLYGIAPGEYVALVEKARHYKHRKNKHDVVQIWLEIEDGIGNVEMIPKYYNVNSKDSRKYMQEELSRIGVEIVNPNDLSKLPSQLNGLGVPITLEYNDQGYPLVYFREEEQEPILPFDLNTIWED